MNRKRKFFLASILISASVFLTLAGVLCLDIYLHHKFSKAAGLNIRGYRGKIQWTKADNEFRIVALGGSTTFGYGVVNEESYPFLLERKLQKAHNYPVSVVNLGMNNNGAYSYLSNLQDYRSLDYDLAILYEGYNDTGENNYDSRRDSGIFRLTGYYPILPIVLNEKALLLRTNGNLEEAYRGKNGILFQPSAAKLSTAAGISAVANAGFALENKLSDLATRFHGKTGKSVPLTTCGVWQSYCANVKRAIDFALQNGSMVLVASQPTIVEQHRDQQRALREMLDTYFKGNERVQYASFETLINVKDKELAFDEMHLTLKGNDRLAGAFFEHIESILRTKKQGNNQLSYSMK